jgi:cytochrome P450
MTVAKGRRLHSMFNTTDEKFHAKLRRAVSNSYAMSTLVKFEPLVDSTTTAFLAQLERRYADRQGADGACDFGTWLQYYAFDVIGMF